MYVISMLYVTIASNAIKINSNFPKIVCPKQRVYLWRIFLFDFVFKFMARF